MATVNFCERLGCETMAKSPAMGQMSFRTAPGREVKSLELCPGCVAELVEFLGTGPTGDRPRSYSEPWNPEEKKSVEELNSTELAKLYGEALTREVKALENK